MVTLVGGIEFEVVRRIRAPIEQVFVRLADIDGHNDWMPKTGSILRHTQPVRHHAIMRTYGSSERGRRSFR